MIHLDTHVVYDLACGIIKRLGERAKSLIEQHTLVVSPLVELELSYLYEIGRIPHGGEKIIDYLGKEIGLIRDTTPLFTVVRKAHALTWTRDPFDRLIVATALSANAEYLITRDKTIHKHFVKAIA